MMESLRELYRIGLGPSSSHTLAPQTACRLFVKHYPEASFFEVTLFGSLALTGVGHATNDIIIDTLAPKMCTIAFKVDYPGRFPNGLIIKGFDIYGNEVKSWTVYSLGGGSIDIDEEDLHLHDMVYPHQTMNNILSFCEDNRISLADYAFRFDKDIKKYLNEVMQQMLKTVDNGLNNTGILPGKLKIVRVAKALHLQATFMDDVINRQRLLLSAYAYAACEENAAGKVCVAAPTMGASGVMAALIYHYYHNVGISRHKLIKGLALAGIFGNLIKHNATISGAVGGCQAEIGTACAMGSAMIAYFNGLSDKLIAYAAEIGIEHHLGLTCDPVGGYVIIPCIERNAVATLRTLDNAMLAEHVGMIKLNRVSFDDVVRTMKYTGMKLPLELRETSLGGLAIEVKINDDEDIKAQEKVNDSSIDLLATYRDLDDLISKEDDDEDIFSFKL